MSNLFVLKYAGAMLKIYRPTGFYAYFLVLFSLISSMLRREPTERISLRNIVHHPWMINTSGKQCCDNSCVALVGRENLAAEDHDLIIHKMVEGGIASRTEILR